MIRRARLLAVVAMLVAGGIGVIGATQTWLVVTLADGSAEALPVPGAAAVPVLTPLSLAVLALGLALSIVGPALRYVFGAVGLAIAAVLGWMSAQVLFAAPVGAVAATVTTVTGVAGDKAIAGLIASVAPTPWPTISVIAALVLGAASSLTLGTASRWRGGAERRYQTATARAAGARPRDAIDSWDDLSRGDDPTS